MNYSVCSGWWCDDERRRHGKEGDDFIRSVDFFDIWYNQIKGFTDPEAIIVVDSNSPTKPDKPDDVEWITMQKNFYPPYHTEDPLFGLQRPASTRQLFLATTYAYFNEIDYNVWIEQDSVIKGRGLVENAIENMGDSWFSLGNWDHPLKKCTSFIVLKTDKVFEIIDEFQSAKGKPELRWHKLSNTIPFTPLPFGYGRNRPIDVNDKYLYVQHTTREELNDILRRT